LLCRRDLVTDCRVEADMISSGRRSPRALPFILREVVVKSSTELPGSSF
jgi:hypothetical protein